VRTAVDQERHEEAQRIFEKSERRMVEITMASAERRARKQGRI
jgi:hypothetical protein